MMGQVPLAWQSEVLNMWGLSACAMSFLTGSSSPKGLLGSYTLQRKNGQDYLILGNSTGRMGL